MSRRLLLVLLLYAGMSAVYLFYLPHALPVLDDWTGLGLFRHARAGGIPMLLEYLHRQIDNTYHFQFRMNWAGILPAFVLSYLADFSGWPYNLFAWTSHLLTALLLYRTVGLLAADERAAFLAGAIYSVFPPVNNILFWSMSTSFYHLEALGLAWWFYGTWKRFAESGDYRWRWTDLARLAAVVFLGEVIFPALLLLLPVTHYLFGRLQDHRPFWRFWAIHAATMAALFGAFVVFVNRMPLAASIRGRVGGVAWSLWPILPRLLASAGVPGLAEWRPEWRFDLPWLAALLLAAACFIVGLRTVTGASGGRSVYARLLLWGLAGTLLTYLPVTILALEWRYLYVPSFFVVAGGTAVLSLLGSRARTALALLAVAYGVSIAYQEMRQCWIPQSRIGAAAIEALSAARPLEAGSTVILSGGPSLLGPAPAFVTGASWALRSAIEFSTGVGNLEGGRDLLVNAHGQFALFRHDGRRPLDPAEIHRLRVFVLDAAGHYQPKSVLAVPAGGDQFRLLALGAGTAVVGLFTRSELQARPDFDQIYFPHPVPDAW